MPEPESDTRTRGLLDTSVVVNIEEIDPDLLPDVQSVSSVTLAELAAGPPASPNPHERARRQERLQQIEATLESLPFDDVAARAYGRVFASVTAIGRKARGRRTVDLFIAATALSNGLPLYTSNPDDFVGLEDLLEIVAVAPADPG
ncbi:MAG TPA: type II toxin-antitoxin system VapC family toxin [Solirubrobacteraceae bacterium]